MGTNRNVRLFVGALLALLLAACSIQLAPYYDQKVVSAIEAANVQTLTLFAALERGSSRADYASFSPRYDEAIGNFEALRMQTEARPVPPLIGHMARIRGSSELCASVGGDLASCVNSSSLWLAKIVERLTNMRQLHNSTGLPADRVAMAKADYEGWMHNLMTIENALKR